MYCIIKFLFYDATFSFVDTMQNVIEQSVLDNNWLPTAESASFKRQPLSVVTIAAVSLLHYLYKIVINSLNSIYIIISTGKSNLECLVHSTR